MKRKQHRVIERFLCPVGIPLIVNTSSGIMNTDSGHREHSPERSDGLASQFIPSESRFSLF